MKYFRNANFIFFGLKVYAILFFVGKGKTRVGGSMNHEIKLIGLFNHTDHLALINPPAMYVISVDAGNHSKDHRLVDHIVRFQLWGSTSSKTTHSKFVIHKIIY